MDLIDKINRCAFFGSEFLTYLWFMSETSEQAYQLAEDEEQFEVIFDDRLTVGGAQVNAQENLFRGGHPTSSLEAHAALRLGKLATEARVRIIRGAQEWSFVLKAGDLSVSALKVPAVLSKKDDDRFYERMYLLEELEKMMNLLYRSFLERRLTDDWERELLPSIREWVGQTENAEVRPVLQNEVSTEPAAQFDVAEDTFGERPPWESPVGDNED